MNEVQLAAVRAAEASTARLVELLVDGDNVSERLRGAYTVEKIEKLVKAFGKRL